MAQKGKRVLLVGAAARKKVFDGVFYLEDAVKRTLGPRGGNFASGIRGGAIHISNDGVSLAKEIDGRDEFEDIGVRAVREAATKTVDAVGDGTTTAIVLTAAILRALDFDEGKIGWSPVKLTKQIREESDVVAKELEAMAIKVETREQLVQVARVSVEDDALAELVGGAQWDVGVSGTVLAEEHNDPKDEVEYVFGVRIDNGLGTTMLANNAQKNLLELNNQPIILTNKVFNKAQDILAMKPVWEKMIADGHKSVILMGRAFDVTALGICLKNIQEFEAGKGGFPIYPINCPYTDMDEVMQDLAAATGGKYIIASQRNVETITPADIGFVSKVRTGRYEGIITGKKQGEDAHVDELVNKRIATIQEKLNGKISPFEERNLRARLAQLTAGTAVIKVGADTEQERKYKKDKVDDVVGTVKAAIEHGVVPGGGLALKLIAEKHPDFLIANAICEPYLQIMNNAGETFAIEPWVQDPLKVVKTAFIKASSIARSLATTEVAVNWEREKPHHCGGVVNTAPEDED